MCAKLRKPALPRFPGNLPVERSAPERREAASGSHERSLLANNGAPGRRALPLLLILWLGLGFAAQAQSTAASAPNPFQPLYLRVTNQFADAIFFKPAEPKAPDLTFSLAPMLLQQVHTNPPVSPPEQFGLLTRSNGVLSVDTTHPAIYVAAGTLQRNGKTYPQLTYLWVYADFNLQGVRITLDAAGQPCLWEILTDSSGADIFYASQHLETAAQMEFGKPLPGRRYALERSWAESPKGLLPRVLEDAPAVMGPMAYLEAGTGDVSTLICRCMPAQVKRLARTATYELVPVSGAAEAWLHEARNLSRKPPTFWLGEGQDGPRLDTELRLPKTF